MPKINQKKYQYYESLGKSYSKNLDCPTILKLN